ncbi:phage portal protein [Pseudomonas lundensis]|uniref:Phage portal protein n=1 Tax=Pseudomonas lundensis TaxID=86185 RepID=A0ABX4GJ90_9PSED|nr:phage portal protein [Pseudomonas lundensis]OZY26551.1 phage portal protein [Pseudomonas lundensis]OZY45235.1 phage portal protein [Pseudomonas lundensis]OZY54081.1 phage portal protein [Pseudomonas lundensis]
MNLLDRILAPVFPGTVAERLRARNVIQAFEASDITRTHKAKKQSKSADKSLQKSAVSLREQCRKLDEDHDIVTGLFDRLEERVVGGSGISVEPIPLTYAGDVDLEFAAAIKAQWSEWSLSPETSGELSRPQMERLMCRTWLRDGEGLAQMLIGRVANYDHLHDVPFALELLEPDYLPWGYTDLAKGISQGIERNGWRRVKAYHLLKQHPGDGLGYGMTLDTKSVPADRIIHIAYRKRIGQNRGQPLLHAVIIRLADIKDYEESERVAARISAALAMYIKKGTPDDFVPSQTKAPERTFPLAPGVVVDTLLPGEDVGMIESNRPNPFLEGFRNGQLKAVAAGTRGTYSSVARSYDGTYSAQRQELVEGQLGYDLLQHEFIDYWCRRVYREWLRIAITSGVLVVPKTVDPRTIYGAIYQGPVMPWINPVHEANAWKILVEAGFADEAEVARARQRNPQELKRTRKAEIETNRAQGLVFSSDAYHLYYGKNKANETEKKPDDDDPEGGDK